MNWKGGHVECNILPELNVHLTYKEGLCPYRSIVVQIQGGTQTVCALL